MRCAEVEKLLEAFVDGELPGGAMRKTARHLAHCPSCEAMAVRLERAQDAVRRAVLAEVEGVDAGVAWNVVSSHLRAKPPPLRERFFRGIGARSWVRGFSGPLWIGSAVAAALVLAFLWAGEWQGPGERRDGLQRVAHQTRIDLLDASGSVHVWNQPESGALVIWVGEEGINMEPASR